MSIHTITYVLFTKNLFSEPCKNLAPRSKSAKFELLNKSFSSTYNFSVEFSKTFSKTAVLTVYCNFNLPLHSSNLT